MEQLELFAGLQPIKLLQDWQEKRRRALLRDAGTRLRGRGETADKTACQRIPIVSRTRK